MSFFVQRLKQQHDLLTDKSKVVDFNDKVDVIEIEKVKELCYDDIMQKERKIVEVDINEINKEKEGQVEWELQKS